MTPEQANDACEVLHDNQDHLIRGQMSNAGGKFCSMGMLYHAVGWPGYVVVGGIMTDPHDRLSLRSAFIERFGMFDEFDVTSVNDHAPTDEIAESICKHFHSLTNVS